MKTLFLAEITLRITPYMESSRNEQITRLVWANDPEHAEDIVNEQFNDPDPYGVDKSVDHVSISRALGSPEDGE